MKIDLAVESSNLNIFRKIKVPVIGETCALTLHIDLEPLRKCSMISKFRFASFFKDLHHF